MKLSAGDFGGLGRLDRRMAQTHGQPAALSNVVAEGFRSRAAAASRDRRGCQSHGLRQIYM